ncbi:hypothetical protein LTR94_028601, partial [Friedmanniomyces endolithicus]
RFKGRIANEGANRVYELVDRPLVGGKDQGVQIETTQFNAEITQKLTDWLTVVLRGQHQNATFALSQYSPFAVLNNSGLLLVSRSGVRQTSTTDAVDGFARIAFDTGPVSHKIVVGATNVKSDTDAIYAANGGMFPYNFLTPSGTLPPLASIYSERSTVIGKQRGYYGQYLVGFGPIHLMAAVRRNVTDFTSIVARFGASSTHAATTVPNFGAVVDITDKLSVFGTVAYGYTPTFSLNAAGNKLPDIRSRNAETGVKWDLFDKRVLINASYFSIRQSNLLDRDPANPRFSIALPGQLGEG